MAGLTFSCHNCVCVTLFLVPVGERRVGVSGVRTRGVGVLIVTPDV
jgi:hypothetical protein